MKPWFFMLFACVVWLWSGAANAEILVEIHDRPMVKEFLQNQHAQPSLGGLAEPVNKSNTPTAGVWIVPFFEADMSEPGDTTLFSIRNESGGVTSVDVFYHDVYFERQSSDLFSLEPREVLPISLRSVPGLFIDPDGYARGIVRIFPSDPVAVDAFQLETRNAFATGGVAWEIGDFCTNWNARFLRFGASGGTNLVVLVNGPQGINSGAPYTLYGDVYSESGAFLNGFTMRTNLWTFEVPAHVLVNGGVDFGFIEIVINSQHSPAGLVEVRHQALGEFSVGHPAVCAD